MTLLVSFFFFFNDTATTEIYTLSLHDALPISSSPARACRARISSSSRRSHLRPRRSSAFRSSSAPARSARSEEHTSELQSPCNLVCRLLLEKKKHNITRRRSEPHSTTRRNAPL